MALVLVSIDDVRAVIGRLEVVEVGGVQYVHAEKLAQAIANLGSGETRWEPTPDGARLPGRMFPDEGGAHLDAPAAPVPASQGEGPCAHCSCETRIPHEGGECLECGCTDYMDSRPEPTPPPDGLAPYVSSPDIESAGIFAKPPISDRPIIQ